MGMEERGLDSPETFELKTGDEAGADRFKRCIWCGATKPVSEFTRNTAAKDGHHSRCKECRDGFREQKQGHAIGYYIDSEGEGLGDVHYFDRTSFSEELLDLGYYASKAAEHAWEYDQTSDWVDGAKLTIVVDQKPVKTFVIAMETEVTFHAKEVEGGE